MNASATKKGKKPRANALLKRPTANDNDDEPSVESLREIPPLDPETGVSFGRGEEGLKLARGWTRAVRGRPKKGASPAGTSTRSVRLQDAEWEALDAFAEARSIKPHAAMREAIVHWLARSQLKDDARAVAKTAPTERPAYLKVDAPVRTKSAPAAKRASSRGRTTRAQSR